MIRTPVENEIHGPSLIGPVYWNLRTGFPFQMAPPPARPHSQAVQLHQPSNAFMIHRSLLPRRTFAQLPSYAPIAKSRIPESHLPDGGTSSLPFCVLTPAITQGRSRQPHQPRGTALAQLAV